MGIVLLSFALSNMVFQPAKLIINPEATNQNIKFPELADDEFYSSSDLSRNIFFLFLFLPVMAIIIYKIKKGKKWKDLSPVLLFALIFITLLALILCFMMLLSPDSKVSLLPLESVTETPAPQRLTLEPLPLGFVIIPGVILTGLVVFLILRSFFGAKEKKSIDYLIQQETLNAKRAVAQGKSFKDTIVNYYLALCTILDKDVKVHRTDSMTTGEFKNKLVQLGTPKEAIHQLTRLFEDARYGNRETRKEDKDLAILCFDRILSYFMEKS